jgi:hypothetical protein
MSMVQQAIEVGAPLHTVYEQIAAFENYPRFMTGVEEVTPLGGDKTHWVMDLDGHRREFDARITELSLDERVSWSTTEGPLLSETITLRPMGETRTQVVAQLEADIAFLMPSDRHGQETLNRRLKEDLVTFKGLVESGVMSGHRETTLTGAAAKQLPGRSGTVAGPVSPASVAARIQRRTTAEPHTGAGWGTAPGDALPGTGGPDRASAGTASGSAPMGGRTPAKDRWGDGMVTEEDRGSAHDY